MLQLYQNVTSSTDVRYSFVTIYNNVDNGEILTFCNRNIGIGVTNPLFRLEIGPGTGTTGSQSMRYFNGTTVLALTTGTPSSTIVSLKVNGSIWTTNSFFASSDTGT
jgi:hypothetical protein